MVSGAGGIGANKAMARRRIKADPQSSQIISPHLH